MFQSKFTLMEENFKHYSNVNLYSQKGISNIMLLKFKFISIGENCKNYVF